ncbi:MAG: hypothetical protein Q7R70_04745 [Candidatus Diapherotrites archaeon]|nr:hypothetical protein [Candidatus Diapherotrites archaeon]
MIYSRKVSVDEAQKSALLVEKKALKMFPKFGKAFKLKLGKKQVTAYVDKLSNSEDCYMHLFLSIDFKKGQAVKILKSPKGEFELKFSK